ncbi:hypothetical protein PAPYR_10042 [Paratrimastix pyriformis]|uniref:Uncharacterized protein n=1 Tax=Paratrimastix pyriformis TaxID=342808 RepID=A0ABQ8U6T5_9EUKA|nr:hypothetical protein PAPYR_10042 [Paratrimastix pyriformis]
MDEFEGKSDIQLTFARRPLFNLEVNSHTARRESICQYLKYCFLSALGLFIAHPTIVTPCYGIYIDHEYAFVSSHRIVVVRGPHESEVRFKVKLIKYAVVSPEMKKQKSAKTASSVALVKQLLTGDTREAIRESLQSLAARKFKPVPDGALVGILPDELVLQLRPTPDEVSDDVVLQLQPGTEPVPWERLAPGRLRQRPQPLCDPS